MIFHGCFNAAIRFLVGDLQRGADSGFPRPAAPRILDLLRAIAALLLIPAGLFGDLGLIAVPLGFGDFAIGLIYMFGLPKELQLSHCADRLD